MPARAGRGTLGHASDNLDRTQGFVGIINTEKGPLQFGTPEYDAYMRGIHLAAARRDATTVRPMKDVLEMHQWDWDTMQPPPARPEQGFWPKLRDIALAIRTGFPAIGGLR